METTIDEIADGIFRLSTFIPTAPLPFNQYLIVADQPLLFHTGMRGLFPAVRSAMARVMPPERLRWISFGHYEADECGAMNEWLELAPQAQVVHGRLGGMLSLFDQAIRPPQALADGEVLDLGGKAVRYLETPHVPHGWDAGLIFEQTTRTLFVGDLFTAAGPCPATTEADIVAPALAMEDAMGATALTPRTAPTIRHLAELEPTTLALMHGPAYRGDGPAALRELAGAYAERITSALSAER
jgi:flavorubredoxin